MPITITVAIYIVTFVFFAIIVLGSFAIAKMGEAADIKRYWIGYIPVLQFFVIGKLIETIDLPFFRIPKAEFVFPLLPILAWAGFFYGNNVILQTVVVFVCAIIWLYAWNTFFLLYCRPAKKANLYTMIGGIFILPLYIFIFLLRKKKPLEI
ncbi:MAG: hypothetical protein WCL54_01010 [Clostridia bacterium]